ncbi:MAG TPA: GGDEF domain-containing protein [Bradyrhizobium sp.]|nr:GGDEF domain-containing protein [Bradyrhizobium sp.]
MLNVPTLWTAFIVNSIALGVIWAYIWCSYPSFEAARFWTASAFASATAAAIAMSSAITDWVAPLVAGGTAVVFSTCVAMMGIRRFFGAPAGWRESAAITAFAFIGLAAFLFGYDSATMRIVVYSLAQATPLALSLKWLMSKQDGRVNAGAQLAAWVAAVVIGIYAFRALGKLLQLGDFSFVHFNAPQSVIILALMFLSMVWNFGFLLMAVDRLRNEAADLALMDDLTGVGNRRQLLQRLNEECAKSSRSGEPFALLVIDLDGFKTINDAHGHAAGDACLQHFALMAQMRLRPGDLLARAGGDEFSVVLPASTLGEGAMIARRIVETCREDAAGCVGKDIPITVSIGVAQWTQEVGPIPDRLIAAADHALYVAKKEGRNRHAVYELSPSLAPEEEPSARLPA